MVPHKEDAMYIDRIEAIGDEVCECCGRYIDDGQPVFLTVGDDPDAGGTYCSKDCAVFDALQPIEAGTTDLSRMEREAIESGVDPDLVASSIEDMFDQGLIS
jgi:hypothetical protein